MTWLLKSVIPVWVLVAISAVVIGMVSPPKEYLVWLPIALAAGIVMSFCIQLALPRKEGLVDRMMASATGSVLLLAIATAIFWPLSSGR